MIQSWLYANSSDSNKICPVTKMCTGGVEIHGGNEHCTHTHKKRHSKFKYTTANFLGIDIYSDEEHNFKAVEKTIRYQKST